MIGFIIFCMAFALLSILTDMISIIKSILSLLIHFIALVIENIWKNLTLNREISKRNLDNTERENRIKQKEEEIEEQNKSNNDYETVMAGNMYNSLRNLRLKYPYADEVLFSLYKEKYQDATYYELSHLEDLMKMANEENKKEDVTKKWTLEDLSTLKPMEIIKESPLELKIYRVNNDYVLYVENYNDKMVRLYQSKNYFKILDLGSDVVQLIDELKIYRKQIKAQDIDELVKNKYTSVLTLNLKK